MSLYLYAACPFCGRVFEGEVIDARRDMTREPYGYIEHPCEAAFDAKWPWRKTTYLVCKPVDGVFVFDHNESRVGLATHGHHYYLMPKADSPKWVWKEGGSR